MRKVKEVISELKEMGYDLNENDFKLNDYIRRFGMEIVNECAKCASIDEVTGKINTLSITNVSVKLAELPTGGLSPKNKFIK